MLLLFVDGELDVGPFVVEGFDAQEGGVLVQRRQGHFLNYR